jgi:MFS family permease
MKRLSALVLPPSIWAIGLMALLMNLSTVIIFSLSPIYLTSVHKWSTFAIGNLEGTVEFIAWTTRIFSGVISDFIRKRKPLLLIAVALTCLARPLFAAASSLFGVFFARSMDRLANGLQASPRDALIGDSAPKGKRGAAFGLSKSLGMFGSSLGAVLLLWWIGEETVNFTQIFWYASIPPLIALGVIFFWVRDNTHLVHLEEGQKKRASTQKLSTIFKMHHIKSLSKEYWILLLVSFLFMLSIYSGAFMILRGEELAHSPKVGPSIMIAQNIMAMLIAYPLGWMFDRFDHRWLLACGFSGVIIANILFIHATTFTVVMIGAGFWGLQIGINQSLLSAKVATTTNETNRGTGFGLFYLTAGAAIYIANNATGELAKVFGLSDAFYYSMATALIALFFLPLLKKH